MKTTITDILSYIGIKNVGFCAFEPLKENLLDCRAKSRLPQNSKTVIMCAFPYKVKEKAPEYLSRYAAITDYHTVCDGMLEAACESLRKKYPQNTFEYFCDNSPIPEVYAAVTAGLGVKGDNGLLITKEYGSFVFLGEIVTDLEISCENKDSECSHCGKCKTACPVNLNKSECLSNLSQKKKINNDELLILKQNNILWGCDICQNACPMNNQAKTTNIAEFIDGYRNEYTPDEDMQNRPYTWRGEKVIQRNYENLTKVPQRKPMRLKGYDYSAPGAYSITICTKNKEKILWQNVGATSGRPQDIPLNKKGKIVDNAINNIPKYYPSLTVDKYVIMPNHIHLLLQINLDPNGRPLVAPTIERVIKQMKGFVTKQIGESIWQKSYFDHIIRGEQDYKEIWQYIENNPVRWQEDEFYTE